MTRMCPHCTHSRDGYEHSAGYHHMDNGDFCAGCGMRLDEEKPEEKQVDLFEPEGREVE